MKRMTTLVAVMLFVFVGAPLAALADHHEGAEKSKSEKSKAQWQEDAKKGQEHAAEMKSDAHKAEKDVKAKGHKIKADAKATGDAATGSAKTAGEKAKGS